jgi:hypothetical protein
LAVCKLSLASLQLFFSPFSIIIITSRRLRSLGSRAICPGIHQLKTRKERIMFVHVATLYSVRPEVADNFIHFVRAGDWHRVARLVAPDLIAYDLLQHQSSPTPLFLCIDFWDSREKYLRARVRGL